ncbi:hypothetical protein MUO79_03860 [Candidatus Bathyarchaeota archaeon]|nr:hypothetical protein [Candidatus Bathyarchaeota archaeon]
MRVRSARILTAESDKLTHTSCTLSQSSQAIKEVISNSRKFLKIVTFRFDSKEFADMLLEKAKNNVDVEVVTTPPDNVAKDELRPLVETMYKELEDNRVKLYLCSWEAGEPRLTTTSMSGKQSAGIGEKWYSLHLQILINENETLVTSRPLTADNTVDIFYLSSETSFMKTALSKFEEIKKLFFEPTRIDGLTIPGEVVNFLDQKMRKETIDLFRATKRLNAKQYQMEKLPKLNLDKGLFISPFDGKMREFLYAFIDSANDYVYFFLETFFDEELVGQLQEKIAAKPQISIRIITRPPERIRQNPQKARELISQALSLGIQVGYLPNIQAKFWVSDKWLAIASGDFNRMNLGHSTSSHYWKADTQLLLLENDKNQIAQMKKKFEQEFTPVDQGSICAKDVNVLLRRMTKRNNLAGSADACRYLSRFKSALIIKTEQDVRYVIDTAVKLAKFDAKSRLEGAYMLMAIVIYHMQRREHRLDEIVEKLEGVESELEIKNAVIRMEQKGLLVKSGDTYRIAPNLGSLQADLQRNMSEF